VRRSDPPAQPHGARRRLAFELTLLWALGAIVHLQALSVGYMADDYGLVGAASARSYRLWDAFPAGRGTYFRPLVMATLRLERLVSAGPLLHHVTNLGLHLTNATLLFAVCTALFKNRIHALVAALVFLLHPLVVTNVFWISGRTDSLCTLCSLVSVLAFVRLCQTGRRGWALASGAALLAALLAKEMGVVVVPVLWALWTWWKLRSREAAPRMAGQSLGAFAALTASYVAFLVVRFYGQAGTFPAPTVRSLLRGMLAVPVALVWPNEATMLRGLVASHPALLLAGLALIAMSGAGAFIALRRQEPAVRCALVVLGAMAAAPLAPLLLSGVNASSRLMYLPLAIACIALAGVLEVFPPATAKLGAVAFVALAAMLLGSLLHGRRWVESSTRTETYCRQLTELRRGADERRRPLFVTSPDELHDVPLYSNDLAAALHHCTRGAFGYLDVVSLAPVSLERPVGEPLVFVRRTDHERLEVSVEPGAILHAEAPYPEATLTIAERTSTGEVRKLDVAVTAPESFDLLYFDGVRLARVPSVGEPSRPSADGAN
jgi:hypothetical protein